MGVPTSEVGYTPAMPRREDYEVHMDMWWQWTKKNFGSITCPRNTPRGQWRRKFAVNVAYVKKSRGPVAGVIFTMIFVLISLVDWTEIQKSMLVGET